MIKYADVIVCLQAGDTGKGKVTHALAKKENEYTHVIRYNGGGNAGHTIFHNGAKFVTHYIPAGVFYGIKSIIGPGCVINLAKFLEEVNTLELAGIKCKDVLFVDKRVHIITSEHIEEDSKDTIIGTTKTGNGPAYRDKYYRKGIMVSELTTFDSYIIDIYEELHVVDQECKILFEGAQGFELDIDWGDYPYVTSSHCTVGGAVLNGVPANKIRKVYGIAKAYRTYVGAKEFEKDQEIFKEIRKVGNEFGATTGRPRQVDWLNMDMLIKAININGVTDLIINKIDILEEVNHFELYKVGETESTKFDTVEEFEDCITNARMVKNTDWPSITFSRTAMGI